MKEWITGRNPVYEVMRAERRHLFQLLVARGSQIKGRLHEIVQLAKERHIPIRNATRKELDAFAANHQGVVLQTSGYPYSNLHDIFAKADESEEPVLLLVLDALQDPQNMGTLLRTAEAVGVQGVLIPFRRTATVTPAVVNASSGASEHLLIAQVNLAQAIKQLKERGVWVVGLDNQVDAFLPQQVTLNEPLALVVGGEGIGMRKLVKTSCDFIMQLPMRGKVGSLNAAVAGSTALYFTWMARGFKQ